MRSMEKEGYPFMSCPHLTKDPFYFRVYWSARWVGDGEETQEERVLWGVEQESQLHIGENIRIFPSMYYDLGTKKETRLSKV